MRFIKVEFVNGKSIQIKVTDQEAEEQFSKITNLEPVFINGEKYMFNVHQINYVVLSDVKPDPTTDLVCDFCPKKAVGTRIGGGLPPLSYCEEHSYYTDNKIAVVCDMDFPDDNVISIDSLTMKP